MENTKYQPVSQPSHNQTTFSEARIYISEEILTLKVETDEYMTIGIQIIKLF